MKAIEDVAEEIFLGVLPSYRGRPYGKYEVEVRVIAKVLTGLVADAVLDNAQTEAKLREQVRKEAYNFGVEKAAEVVQKWIDNNCVGPSPAVVIRALKDRL